MTVSELLTKDDDYEYYDDMPLLTEVDGCYLRKIQHRQYGSELVVIDLSKCLLMKLLLKVNIFYIDGIFKEG